MSVLLRAQDIAKAFGVQTLFDDLKLSIEDGQRLGIIGPNGAGKSTLLKILAGLESPDAGEVIRRNHLRLAYVPQHSQFDETRKVGDILEQAAAELPEMERHAAVAVTLGKLGFTDPDQKVASLSGGWRKRLTLACGLVGEPELLLLDEPTNHLDMEGVWRLEELLRGASFTWVMISHDRAFIDRTVNQVGELNAIFEDGILFSTGGYKPFCEFREAYLDAQEKQYASLQNKVRRETEWLRAGVKARTTKAKYRIDAAYGLIAELDAMKQRRDDKTAGIAFSASNRKTRKLIEVKNLAKTMGDKPILDHLDFVFKPGSRTGILGANGTGKTTFLRLLNKELDPERGEVFHAPNLSVVYFDQRRRHLNPDETVQQALSPTGTDGVVYRGQAVHVMSWATRFRFKADQMRMPVGQLSGGEQARLLIARLMLQPADVLLLDEPTNDLDIPTLEILEESLLDFPGALILVTHDRFMLERVCTQFLAFDGAGQLLPCSDHRQWERSLREASQPKANATTTAKPKQTAKPKPKKLSYKEQRELDGMEETILEAEEALETAKAHANDPAIASNGPKLTEAFEALHKAEAEVARLYERWAELGEKVG